MTIEKVILATAVDLILGSATADLSPIVLLIVFIAIEENMWE